jgi:hypothetical protein
MMKRESDAFVAGQMLGKSAEDAAVHARHLHNDMRFLFESWDKEVLDTKVSARQDVDCKLIILFAARALSLSICDCALQRVSVLRESVQAREVPEGSGCSCSCVSTGTFSPALRAPS